MAERALGLRVQRSDHLLIFGQIHRISLSQQLRKADHRRIQMLARGVELFRFFKKAPGKHSLPARLLHVAAARIQNSQLLVKQQIMLIVPTILFRLLQIEKRLFVAPQFQIG